MNDFKQAADELDAEISRAILKMDAQAALIRELVGALEEAKQTIEAGLETESSNEPDWCAHDRKVVAKANAALSRVPEELK